MSQPTRIVWAVLLASQAIYLFVGFTRAGSAGFSLATNRVFPMALGLIALVTGGIAHFFWRRPSGAALPAQQTTPQTPDQAQRAFTFFILAWVLDESIAIYGLVRLWRDRNSTYCGRRPDRPAIS